MDTTGRGIIAANNATYQGASAIMRRSERTIHNLTERLINSKLIKRIGGKLHLCSFDRISEYAGVNAHFSKKKFHHFNPVKLPKSTPFEYILRIYEESESQDRQRYAKRQKMKQYHQCLTLSFYEEKNIESRDFQALVKSFLTGANHNESCDPDTARSHATRAFQMQLQSNASGHYWQQRLEKLGLIDVERDRLIISPKRKDLERYSRLGSVFYSRESQSTVLQLPNKIHSKI